MTKCMAATLFEYNHSVTIIESVYTVYEGRMLYYAWSLMIGWLCRYGIRQCGVLSPLLSARFIQDTLNCLSYSAV
jgi:hypothetical protein